MVVGKPSKLVALVVAKVRQRMASATSGAEPQLLYQFANAIIAGVLHDLLPEPVPTPSRYLLNDPTSTSIRCVHGTVGLTHAGSRHYVSENRTSTDSAPD
eukprot:COSAG02_NODE_284_length_25691_cov_14.733354_6_plen_100_part_00